MEKGGQPIIIIDPQKRADKGKRSAQYEYCGRKGSG